MSRRRWVTAASLGSRSLREGSSNMTSVALTHGRIWRAKTVVVSIDITMEAGAIAETAAQVRRGRT